MAQQANLSWTQDQFFGGFSDDRFLGTARWSKEILAAKRKDMMSHNLLIR